MAVWWSARGEHTSSSERPTHFSLTDDSLNGDPICRKSSVFILDADSGKVLRAVTGGRVAETEVDEALRLLDPFIDEEEGTYSDTTGRARKTRQLVILGREDYVVRSMKVDTGAEVWNGEILYLAPLRAISLLLPEGV
jgi:hypothetical protein